ncbi:MAG: glutamate mutase L [Anaerolineae bacterium]|jgi:hypothetical protein
MAEQATPESFLAADIGSTMTHAVLVDRVEGAYRMVATAESPTTLQAPESDITIGLSRAIRRLQDVVQRPLLDSLGQIVLPERVSGAGVDALVTVSSAAPPLRCVIVGMAERQSVESATRACEAASAQVVARLPLAGRLREWSDETIEALVLRPPDVIVMVGGVDAGPVEPLLEAARVLAILYEETPAERRPSIIYAGNLEARRPVAQELSPVFRFRAVENVRPSAQVESLGELQAELMTTYEEVALARLPGYPALRDTCAAPILGSQHALGLVLQLLGSRENQGVVGVDVGGARAFAGVARNPLYHWASVAGAGTGASASTLVERVGPDEIGQWLLEEMPPDGIVDRAASVALRPHGIPQSFEELGFLHALARASLSVAVGALREQRLGWDEAERTSSVLPRFDLIAARGGVLGHTVQDGAAMLTCLDSVQPVGLNRLVIDRHSLWPQVGAIGQVWPLAAVQLLQQDALYHAGTIIAPVGELRHGARALRIVVRYDDGRTIERDVAFGDVARLPLARGARADIEVYPHRRLDIGTGHAGQGGRARVPGGGLGIVVDARGRPLPSLGRVEDRRARIRQWLDVLGCDVGSSD